MSQARWNRNTQYELTKVRQSKTNNLPFAATLIYGSSSFIIMISGHLSLHKIEALTCLGLEK
jgi:hypothetical protein